MSESTEDAKKVIVGEIIEAAKNNPDIQEAGRTIAKTINNVLLPLAAVNFAIHKAKDYFSNKFQKDLSEKAKSIPPEHLIEPKASVAGPALQGLAFSHEEPNLKEMYLNLLATAMDGRKADGAHPAFVEIIKQLTSEEAHYLRYILSSSVAFPIVEIRRSENGKPGWKELMRHLLDLRNEANGEMSENPRVPAMVDNWIRQGLVHVDYMKHLQKADAYNWVEKRPEYLKLREEHETDTVKISYEKGIIVRTSFGAQFAQAVGIQDIPTGGEEDNPC